MDLFKFYGILSVSTPWIFQFYGTCPSLPHGFFKFYGILSVFTLCIYLNSIVSYYMNFFKFYGFISGLLHRFI